VVWVVINLILNFIKMDLVLQILIIREANSSQDLPLQILLPVPLALLTHFILHLRFVALVPYLLVIHLLGLVLKVVVEAFRVVAFQVEVGIVTLKVDHFDHIEVEEIT